MEHLHAHHLVFRKDHRCRDRVRSTVKTPNCVRYNEFLVMRSLIAAYQDWPGYIGAFRGFAAR